MQTNTHIIAAIGLSAGLLSACGGGGSVMPDTAQTALADFLAIEEAAPGLGATVAMPVSGSTNYEGNFVMEAEGYDMVVVGDAGFNVNYAAGTMSGEASNFRSYMNPMTPEEASMANEGSIALNGGFSPSGDIALLADGFIMFEGPVVINEVLGGQFYGPDAELLMVEGIESDMAGPDLYLGIRAAR